MVISKFEQGFIDFFNNKTRWTNFPHFYIKVPQEGLQGDLEDFTIEQIDRLVKFLALRYNNYKLSYNELEKPGLKPSKSKMITDKQDIVKVSFTEFNFPHHYGIKSSWWTLKEDLIDENLIIKLETLVDYYLPVINFGRLDNRGTEFLISSLLSDNKPDNFVQNRIAFELINRIPKYTEISDERFNELKTKFNLIGYKHLCTFFNFRDKSYVLDYNIAPTYSKFNLKELTYQSDFELIDE